MTSTVSIGRAYRPAGVVRIVDETADCRSFELELERSWTSLPGQYCTVAVTIDGLRHFRCYSLSSVAGLNERPTLTVKRRRGGLVSGWLNDALAVGGSIEVSEPAGAFVVRPGTAPLLFLAAGSGISPIFAMLRAALLEGGRRVTLLYVNRRASDVIFASRLEALQRAFAGRFTVHYAFTAGRGMIPGTLLEDTIAGSSDAHVYLCGPAGFMRTCERVAASSGVAPEHIFSESFAPITADDDTLERGLSLYVQRHNGARVVVRSHAGATLLHALAQTGEPQVGICGGQASCGTCRVTIAAPWTGTLVPPTRSERRLLAALPAPAEHHRLACQVRLTSEHANLVFAPAPLT